MAREHRLTVSFDEFGWEALTREATRNGVSVEEVVEYAALYFLSDVDSGRFATRILQRANEVDEGGTDEVGGASSKRFGREETPDRDD